MGLVSTGFSMSLDGYVADPNEDFSRLFAWMSQGQTDYQLKTGGGALDLKISDESVNMFEEAINSAGALVAGRRLFDLTHGWGGRHPIGAPVVVVTHNPPGAEAWDHTNPDFYFVTEGLEAAIAKAQEIAGAKKVVIASATIVQQALRLGLLDEIHIDLVPYLLNDGVKLFDQLAALGPIDLEITGVSQGVGVTHLTYRVKK